MIITQRWLMALFALLLSTSLAAAPKPYVIDDQLKQAMVAFQVPVVGYAIIDNHHIVAANTMSIDPALKVTEDSLFQAASISKSVAALTALHLLAQQKYKLDMPVNDYLKRWKIPENAFTHQHPVTPRQLMNMTSGLSVSGFLGYAQHKPLPHLIELLEGKPPANNAAVRVFFQPGSRYFYSGGSTQVLQVLIEDLSRQAFSNYATQQILAPLKMQHSTYQFPLQHRKHAVPAFDWGGKPIAQGWRNYAIPAAGGLWSTPTDLAKFIIGISQAYRGKESNIISQPIAQSMLTRGEHTSFGLGVIVNGNHHTLNFRKSGHNRGYISQVIMFPNAGKGLAIMTNAESGMELIHYIIPFIARHYQWPCFFPITDELMTIPEFACYQQSK